MVYYWYTKNKTKKPRVCSCTYITYPQAGGGARHPPKEIHAYAYKYHSI